MKAMKVKWFQVLVTLSYVNDLPESTFCSSGSETKAFAGYFLRKLCPYTAVEMGEEKNETDLS